jgi:hypothetical protein
MSIMKQSRVFQPRGYVHGIGSAAEADAACAVMAEEPMGGAASQPVRPDDGEGGSRSRRNGTG